jgi:hypothetical protein
VSWGVSSLKLDKCGGSHFGGNVSYPHVSQLLLSAAEQANSTPIMLACSWPDYARVYGGCAGRCLQHTAFPSTCLPLLTCFTVAWVAEMHNTSWQHSIVTCGGAPADTRRFTA